MGTEDLLMELLKDDPEALRDLRELKKKIDNFIRSMKCLTQITALDDQDRVISKVIEDIKDLSSFLDSLSTRSSNDFEESVMNFQNKIFQLNEILTLCKNDPDFGDILNYLCKNEEMLGKSTVKLKELYDDAKKISKSVETEIKSLEKHHKINKIIRIIVGILALIGGSTLINFVRDNIIPKLLSFFQ